MKALERGQDKMKSIEKRLRGKARKKVYLKNFLYKYVRPKQRIRERQQMKALKRGQEKKENEKH